MDDYNNNLLVQDIIGCFVNMLIGGIGSSVEFKSYIATYLKDIGTNVSQDEFHLILENWFYGWKKKEEDEQ